MQRLLTITCITSAVLLTLGSVQTIVFAQQASQVNPDTTVSNILEETDSDSAAQLMAPGNTSDNLSVSVEDLPVIRAPERRHEEVIDALSVEQFPFEEKNRSLTIIDFE